ncbi:putative btb poz domain protein [Lasiodiplodia theobromae]|nr:putative btb poz domain protein [Lasiodiplodia theobromae]
MGKKPVEWYVDCLGRNGKKMYSLLKTGEWGDITVKYGDITRTLHSAIVCSQSPFFADAVTKAVTEAQPDTVIEINGWNQWAVNTVIQYMYFLDDFEFVFHEDGDWRDLVEYAVDICGVATQFGLDELTEFAVREVEHYLGDWWEWWDHSSEGLARVICDIYERDEFLRPLRPVVLRIVSRDFDKLVGNRGFLAAMRSVQNLDPKLREVVESLAEAGQPRRTRHARKKRRRL